MDLAIKVVIRFHTDTGHCNGDSEEEHLRSQPMPENGTLGGGE